MEAKGTQRFTAFIFPESLPEGGRLANTSAQSVRVFALLIVALFAITAFGAATSATIETSIAKLPERTYSLPAVWTGSRVVTFGGDALGGLSSSMHTFDPAIEASGTLSSSLPGGRHGLGAVAGDGVAYLFGGYGCGGAVCDTILSVNFETGSVSTISSKLPSPREHVAAARVGAAAYLFGGSGAGGRTDQIVKFDLATHAVTVMGARLPVPMFGAAAASDGERVFLFGGNAASGRLDTILRYDPTTDSVTALSKRLPSGRDSVAAAPIGDAIYLFGGVLTWPTSFSDEIMRFDPSTTTLETLSTRLPTGLQGAAIASDGAAAYLLAGRSPAPSASSAPTWLDQILRFAPEPELSSLPSAPQSLVAVAGPGIGEIALAWDPPLDLGTPSATAYHVYGGAVGGFLTLIGTTSEPSFVESDLSANVTRAYRVAAVNSVGRGPFSNEATARTFAPPPIPQNLTATPIGVGRVELSWDSVPGDARFPLTAFTVNRMGEGVSETNFTIAASSESFVDTPLDSGLETVVRTLRYRVSALNDVGESGRSAAACSPSVALPAATTSPVGEACPASGFESAALAHIASPTLPPLPLLPDWDTLFYVEGQAASDNPNTYDLSAEVLGRTLPLVSIYPVGLVAPDFAVGSPSVPNPYEEIRDASLQAEVGYTYDPSSFRCAVAVSHECVVPLPADPLAPEEFADEAGRAGIVVRISVEVAGQAVTQHVFVPIAGQVVALAADG